MATTRGLNTGSNSRYPYDAPPPTTRSTSSTYNSQAPPKSPPQTQSILYQTRLYPPPPSHPPLPSSIVSGTASTTTTTSDSYHHHHHHSYVNAHSNNHFSQLPFDQRVRGQSVEEKLAIMRRAQQQQKQQKGSTFSNTSNYGRGGGGGGREEGRGLAEEEAEKPVNVVDHNDAVVRDENNQGGVSYYRTMPGRLVNGTRTTTRPLSPPSPAGLPSGTMVTPSPLPHKASTSTASGKQLQIQLQEDYSNSESYDDDDDDDDDDSVYIENDPQHKHKKNVRRNTDHHHHHHHHSIHDDLPDDERSVDRRSILNQYAHNSSSTRGNGAIMGHTRSLYPPFNSPAVAAATATTTHHHPYYYDHENDVSLLTTEEEVPKTHTNITATADESLFDDPHAGYNSSPLDLCSQTFQVIEEMCGRGLPGLKYATATTEPPPPPSQVSKTRVISSSNVVVAHSNNNNNMRSSWLEMEEEQTAIEVEYVEMNHSDPAAADISDDDDVDEEEECDEEEDEEEDENEKEEEEEKDEQQHNHNHRSENVDKSPTDTNCGDGTTTTTTLAEPAIEVDIVPKKPLSNNSGSGSGSGVSNSGSSSSVAAAAAAKASKDKDGPMMQQQQKLVRSSPSFGSTVTSSSLRNFQFWKRPPSRVSSSTKPPEREDIDDDNDHDNYLHAATTTSTTLHAADEDGGGIDVLPGDSVLLPSASTFTREGESSVPQSSSSYLNGSTEGVVNGNILIIPVPDLTELPGVDETHPESQSSSSDSENDLHTRQFAKSGINYYDAVRRNELDDSSDEEDSMHEVEAVMESDYSQNAIVTKNSKVRRLFSSKLSKQFTPLKEDAASSPNAGRSKEAPLRNGSNALAAKVSDTTRPEISGTSRERANQSLDTGRSVEEVMANLDEEGGPPSMMVTNSIEVEMSQSNATATTAVAQEMTAMTSLPLTQVSEVSSFDVENRLDSIALGTAHSFDVHMHAYMNSTEMYEPSIASAATAAALDNMTIYTSATMTSSMSPRVRRPGAAKDRLAKTKETEGTLPSRHRGWHESMKAAAATHNRIWDPKIGWVDYTQQMEKSLASTQSPTVATTMNESPKTLKPNSDGTDDDVNSVMARPSSPAQLEKNRTTTMQANYVLSPTPEEQSKMMNQLATWSASGDAWSESGVGSTILLDETSASVEDQSGVYFSAVQDDKPSPLVNEIKEKQPVKPSLQHLHFAKVSPEARAEKKFVPLGGSGAVQSTTKDLNVMKSSPVGDYNPQDDTDDDDVSYDDKAPLLSESGSFNSMSLAGSYLSPAVNVVKRKVEKDDLLLFTHEESPHRESAQKLKIQTQQNLSPSRRINPSSPGRHSCPVDLDDEIDDSYSEDDEGVGVVMQSRNDTETNTKSYINDDKASNDFNFIPATAMYKSIPRLQSSKRDSSPLKTRHNHEDDMFAVDEAIPPVTPRVLFENAEFNSTKADSSRKSKSLAAIRDDELSDIEADLMWISGGNTNVEVSASYSPEQSVEPTKSDSYMMPSVKSRLHNWEVRTEKSDSDIKETVSDVSTELKALLGKKLDTELSVAATQRNRSNEEMLGRMKKTAPQPPTQMSSSLEQQQLNGVPVMTRRGADDDSLFQFHDIHKTSMSRNSTVSLTEVSDVSPIEHAEDSDKDIVSEAYGPRPGERSSFFKRLVECTAPVMPLKNACGRMSDSTPTEVNGGFEPQQTRPAAVYVSPIGGESNFTYGDSKAPGVIKSTVVPLISDTHPTTKQSSSIVNKETKTAEQRRIEEGPLHSKYKTQEYRSYSAPRPRPQFRDDSYAIRSPSSVVSEDFGAKTAYLEAIAARAAVSKPRRSNSSHVRNHRSSYAPSDSMSVASTTASVSSSQHSEKWKALLQKKKAGMIKNNIKSSSRSEAEVSKAAEKYAAEKLEEMMRMMSTKQNQTAAVDILHNKRPHSNVRQRGGTEPTNSPSSSDEESTEPQKIPTPSESGKNAAQDLAAARVEAMMAALSGRHLDEAEI